LSNPAPSIQTVAGEAFYTETLTDQELNAGDFSTKNGYWVIHRGEKHHVYKVYPKEHGCRYFGESWDADVIPDEYIINHCSTCSDRVACFRKSQET